MPTPIEPEFYNAYDTDRDGTITQDELTAKHGVRQHRREPQW